MLDRVVKMLSQWAILFKGVVLFIMLPMFVARFVEHEGRLISASRYVDGMFVGIIVVILTMIIVAIGEE